CPGSDTLCFSGPAQAIVPAETRYATPSRHDSGRDGSPGGSSGFEAAILVERSREWTSCRRIGNRPMIIPKPIRRSVSMFIAAVAATACLSGCATIAGGGHDQRVHIDSEPHGAQVWVDGQPQGITPTDVTLSRRQEHQVQLELEGYPPYVSALKPGCNPW